MINPEHTREYDVTNNGVRLHLWARPNSCFFCDHCTDIFIDLDGSPYMWFCEKENEIDVGMLGKCEDFREEQT